MTPAARIQAVIEMMDRIGAFAEPADRIVAEFVRSRRFIGSKDRRAVTDRVFAILRALARLDWCWARAGGADAAAVDAAAHGEMVRIAGNARDRVLAALVLIEGHTLEHVSSLCDGSTYGPAPLSAAERERLGRLAEMRLDQPEQPEWVRVETPEWLLASFKRGFGAATATELAALSEPAQVDLRVNPLRADDRLEVAAELASVGIEAAATPYARSGLRLAGRRAVTATSAFKNGRIEVQDEGAQIAAALVDARPGQAVCDLCAGAGGKTLALAADMQDSGTLVALDRDDGRLGAAGPRLARAGVHSVERRRLMGTDDPWIGDNAGRFQRVLVDAPCSGTGTWRRHPDIRWRFSEAALTARLAEQDTLLDQAARLLQPGGRLIYTTCSLLPEENAERVAALVTAHPHLAARPIDALWRERLDGEPPVDIDATTLTLTPAKHGTDGFFIAVLAHEGRRQ